MASALKFTPGSSIRWRGKRYVVVDYAGMDSIIARELGKVDLNTLQSGTPHQIGRPGTEPRGRPISSLYRKALGKEP